MLDERAMEGARRMLAAALEIEVDSYIERHRSHRDSDGHAMVVRNGKAQTLRATVEELDLDAERTGRQARGNEREQPEEQGQDSFGLTLGNLTPQMSRRLQMPSGQAGAVVTDVDDSGPSSGILRPGDVILSVNGQAVSSAVDAGRELQKIPAGRIARILVWRGDGEVFVTVRKE